MIQNSYLWLAAKWEWLLIEFQLCFQWLQSSLWTQSELQCTVLRITPKPWPRSQNPYWLQCQNSIYLVILIFLWIRMTYQLLVESRAFSLSAYLAFLFVCSKHWSCFFHLLWVEVLFIDLLYNISWYFYFAFLRYFLLISLISWGTNKLLGLFLVERWEGFQKYSREEQA